MGVVREYLDEYEFRFDDGGGHCPNDNERALLEDFGEGLLEYIGSKEQSSTKS